MKIKLLLITVLNLSVTIAFANDRTYPEPIKLSDRKSSAICQMLNNAYATLKSYDSTQNLQEKEDSRLQLFTRLVEFNKRAIEYFDQYDRPLDCGQDLNMDLYFKEFQRDIKTVDLADLSGHRGQPEGSLYDIFAFFGAARVVALAGEMILQRNVFGALIAYSVAAGLIGSSSAIKILVNSNEGVQTNWPAYSKTQPYLLARLQLRALNIPTRGLPVQ